MPCPNTPVLEVASEVWWWKAAVRALSVWKVFRWGVICVYDIVLYYNKTDYQFFFFSLKISCKHTGKTMIANMLMIKIAYLA